MPAHRTIHGAADELRQALTEYIEAQYHISDVGLIRQRRGLLQDLGIVHQTPYLESTPRYKTGDTFAKIEGLPPAARRVFELLAQPGKDGKPVFYDPPYTHQAEAVRLALAPRWRNLVITTGTGSGKTESFLMPVMGKLAREASTKPDDFARMGGMRAMILYPMNALVNDQLTRLRNIVANPQVVEQFKAWAGRPPRFTRYTSRTPYAGLRDKAKDQRRLKPIRDFYIQALNDQAGDDPEKAAKSAKLIEDLKKRGKWPAKPDLRAWFEGPSRYWQDEETGEFQRAVTLEDDSELITRHEAQDRAPDLLVTNYSMLEYMMMRPLERPIFEQTRAWLAAHPEESFLLILDEAHLYRGAGGAEVGLLLRRLRDRLAIPPERLQVICATASFGDREYAPRFASKLTGVPEDSFEVISGDQKHKDGAAAGDPVVAQLLADLDMDGFRDEKLEVRARAIAPLLRHCGVAQDGDIAQALHTALDPFPPLSLLVNETMRKARPVASLGALVFPGTEPDIADMAVTNLASLATFARQKSDDPSLLPCRVHNFFRGLPGLWVCMNADCSEVAADDRSVAGKLYSQPMTQCACGSRVVELFTCRQCGTAYGRGYSDNPESPTVVWSEPGAKLRGPAGTVDELLALDMLLTPPAELDAVEEAIFDLFTGRINAPRPAGPTRRVYLRPNRRPAPVAANAPSIVRDEQPGAFMECPVCDRDSWQDLSPVQNHETKGDQPFQVLLTRQLQIQPESPVPATAFAPLRGRKVLAFSDSRQVAARLAPNLQTYSARDSLRSLIMRGWRRLARVPGLSLRLDDLYPAVLIAASELRVRLKPELGSGETFAQLGRVAAKIDRLLASDTELMTECYELRGERAPETLMADILSALRNGLLGLEPLALASLAERQDLTATLHALPDLQGLATTPQQKVELVRAWIREWTAAGFLIQAKMNPHKWYEAHPDKSAVINSRTGEFARSFGKRLGSSANKKLFKTKWLPKLLELFCDDMGSGKFVMNGSKLTLALDGSWVRCGDCKSVHRPVSTIHACLDCGHPATAPLDPDNDAVFLTRKGHFRKAVLAALDDVPEPPISIIAAEHTAQLNTAQAQDVFSKAEENELLFQDVELPQEDNRLPRSAIDVLSSTTTMEVGIDIGQLSGVALRNMPPARANYQQRAGRAGRRGSAIATVVAYGGSDTHDENFFSKPADMITGQVVDPKLNLENPDIACRHIRSFLLQTYHRAKLPVVAGNRDNELFSVLGKVEEFQQPRSVLSRADFERWLIANRATLRAQIAEWLPNELSDADRTELLEEFVKDCLQAIDMALYQDGDAAAPQRPLDDETQYLEVQPEADESRPAQGAPRGSLLERLLYCGVLPRYAFPTDVVTFHVFNREASSDFRHEMAFTPSQGLTAALSQYAPGKQVWIAGKCYVSGAIYSQSFKERKAMWDKRRLHVECRACGYSFTESPGQTLRYGEVRDCPACRSGQSLGPARYWIRPTGFAHPVDVPEVTSPEELPETAYATRAKLTMDSPPSDESIRLSPRIRYVTRRHRLLVSNTGPKRSGYAYCTACGRIEASTESHGVVSGRHQKPFPDKTHRYCPGNATEDEVILGTDFITDVALFTFRLEPKVRLTPTASLTHIVLRTLCVALSRAATELLGIEPGEVLAEYRPALTSDGTLGLEAEIFLYDTLSGGAGYASAAADAGLALFEEALAQMRDCEGACDNSCYRCLRDFRNRIDHGVLDRHIGIGFVEYLLTGYVQPFNARRLTIAGGLLRADVERQGVAGFRFEGPAHVTCEDGRAVSAPFIAHDIRGTQYLVNIRNPLLEEQSRSELVTLQPDGRSAMLIETSELVVQKNLANATTYVIDELTRSLDNS